MNEIDFLKQREVVDFIFENRAVEVTQLILNPPKKYKERIKLITDQIQARQKGKEKLRSWVQNKELIFPPPLSIEQASSEATSQYKTGLMNGPLLVDLTGGAGVDCLALSHFFKHTIYVEQNPWLCQTFAHNSALLGQAIQVKNQNAEDFIQNIPNDSSLFIDPARRDDARSRVFKLEDCSPNVLDLLPRVIDKATHVLVKLSPLLDVSHTLNLLSNVKEVHVVSVKNECKELLFLMERGFAGVPTIHAVNLQSSQAPFVFKVADEDQTIAAYHDHSRFLYEPNASILKSGAFKLIGSKYQLNKLAANTHLYSSEKLEQEFPGKAFEIMVTNAKSHLEKYQGKINVLTRNYPLNAVELKKKFKLKDGGDDYLIGFRNHMNEAKLVIAKRLL